VSPALPSITGRQLTKLLVKDGWVIQRRATHGIALHKKFPDGRVRVAIVPDHGALNPFVLGAILSVKQTGIGSSGLLALIRVHGLK
jgi:predicted RNA binding protein YcfA (HicA-like mRNA interferase family)